MNKLASRTLGALCTLAALSQGCGIADGAAALDTEIPSGAPDKADSPRMGRPGDAAWARGFGEAAADPHKSNSYSTAVRTDPHGDVYVTGYFSGRINFGRGFLYSAGGEDAFVAKFSPAGALIWARRFGGTGDDEGHDLALDDRGDIFLTGSFEQVVELGASVLTSAGGQDVIVAKFGPDSDPLWARGYGGPGDDAGSGLAYGGAGGVIVTGRFEQTASFGGAPLTSAGGTDLFAARLSGAGTTLWSQRAGGPLNDEGDKVAVDGRGGVAIIGSGQGSGGDYDALVLKLSDAGASEWSKRLGGPKDDVGEAVAFDRDGNLLVAGGFQGAASFGGATLSSAGDFDVFVARYGPAGDHRWSIRGGGAGYDAAFGLGVDVHGDPFVTGVFLGGDFGGGALTYGGEFDVFVAHYAGDTGAHVWSRGYGGPDDDRAFALAVDSVGRVVIGGDFASDHGPADFGGVTLRSHGASDVFLTQLHP